MSILDVQVFVSTGAFGHQSLIDILRLCSEKNLSAIELSSGVNYSDEIYNFLINAFNTTRQKFLVHNYFPPPKKPFVLNLASNKEEILNLSRQHCKKAITMASELNAPFYSVHSGFCFHAEPEHLGRDQTKLERIPKKEAEEIFIDSLKNLADYSASKGVDLIIENNVVTPFNLIDGENELLLGVTSDELLRILNAAALENLGLLLDVGHLKVSANALGFCPESFIQDTSHMIKAVHLSDNDGQRDTHHSVSQESWFWKPLFDYVPHEITWILEAYNLPLELIIEQVSLISTMVNKDCHMR